MSNYGVAFTEVVLLELEDSWTSSILMLRKLDFHIKIFLSTKFIFAYDSLLILCFPSIAACIQPNQTPSLSEGDTLLKSSLKNSLLLFLVCTDILILGQDELHTRAACSN